MEDVYEPLQKYRDEFRVKFAQLTAKAFDRLTRASGVDVAANAGLVAKIRSLERRIARERSVRQWKGFLVSLVAVVISCLGYQVWRCLAPFFDAEGPKPNMETLFWFGISLACALALEFVVLVPWYRDSTALLARLKDKRDETESTAWRQMEPLNRLYDWDMTLALIQKTVPRLEFDKYFTERRLQDLRTQFGWSDEFNRNRSVLFAQTGQINGNPFVVGECLRHELGGKTYTGSLDISWTERERGSDGKMRTVRKTETLHASVNKPCPYFRNEKFVIYGNEAASKLTFSRQPSDLSGLDDGFFDSWRKRGEIKKLEALSRNLDDDLGYTMMPNKEFEALFHTTDRNDEVEFRLLFTPLAQTQMLALLKDKEVGYGDDFAMYKDRRITVVWPKHLRDAVIDTNPTRFRDFDYARAKANFQRFNEQYFKDVYFAMAPLLTIPLYQQTRTHTAIYGESLRHVSSFWEHESIANFCGEKAFQHPTCVTRNILKTTAARRPDGTSSVAVTAQGYCGLDRVDFVKTYGGDGAYHDVPVHWTEYRPVEKTSSIVVSERDVSPPATLRRDELWRRSIIVRRERV